jgi:arylsulfatase A-like enzyme
VERRALTTLADIFPTFCDAAGIAAPREARGVSLLKPLPDRFVVSELRYASPDWDGRMLRTARYKYVAFNNGARPEQLFDLELDPGETVNLAASKPAALGDHQALLRRWLKETGDGFRMPG